MRTAHRSPNSTSSPRPFFVGQKLHAGSPSAISRPVGLWRGSSLYPSTEPPAFGDDLLALVRPEHLERVLLEAGVDHFGQVDVLADQAGALVVVEVLLD